MLKYFPLYLVFICWSCGSNDAPQSAESQANESTTKTTAAATNRVESPEQMQELIKYSMDIQRQIFNMEKEQSLSYTISDNVFNFELYQAENGDTLAVVNNGSLGKYSEFDRYIFYKNNRPVVMLVDRLRRDASQQMFMQIVNFYRGDGQVEPTTMLRRGERKADMLADKFVMKDLGEVHSIYQYVDEFKQGMEHTGDFTLYFDEFITEEGRSYLRFKVADEPTNSKFFVTAIRLPENFRDDATLAKVEKNSALYKNKKVEVEWETIKMKTGQRIPQWVSGTFE